MFRRADVLDAPAGPGGSRLAAAGESTPGRMPRDAAAAGPVAARIGPLRARAFRTLAFRALAFRMRASGWQPSRRADHGSRPHIPEGSDAGLLFVRELLAEVLVQPHHRLLVQHGRQRLDGPHDALRPGDGDVGVGDAEQVRLGGHADERPDQPAVRRRKDGRDGGTLRQRTLHRLGTCVAALPEHPGCHPHLTGPVLGIHHHNAAGADQHVVQVGLRAPRPVHVVQDVPAAGNQLTQLVRHHPFARGPRVPRLRGTLGLVELALEPGNPLSSQPGLLGRSVSCPHGWSLLPCRRDGGGRPPSSLPADVLPDFPKVTGRAGAGI
ncbi:hypothetical protein G205_15370 [Arthrobacter nitrophenolicus]|uniref:Uncharacterized protein n=1 Tax=Arthrobacter nitrophenolicus TaxID=683150 RepID=L8TQ02_9MICC|nr:hypothetical protein G205_15370 [Arthrobacter nitrophenolicus]